MEKDYACLGTEDMSLRMCLTMLHKSLAHHLLGRKSIRFQDPNVKT